MQYMRDYESFDYEGPTAVTLGKFDGLHRGHQKLVEK
ncbi:MAG: riboflavin biosynthesis protein RibF, partial [Hespellia sp.]|nr:riboflavin biosynthesis protein RibF [Hespellia sp.]